MDVYHWAEKVQVGYRRTDPCEGRHRLIEDWAAYPVTGK